MIIFMMDSGTVDLFDESGLRYNIAELPVSKVENQGQQYIDACEPYGMPYAWGSIGRKYGQTIRQRFHHPPGHLTS
jgi:hypothetical protein